MSVAADALEDRGDVCHVDPCAMTRCPPSLHLPDGEMHGLRRQRVDGALRLAYRCDAQRRTRLSTLYQRAPCRVLFPDTEPRDTTQAVLLTTSGGLTGGDRLKIEVEIGAGARATLTTQAAEKIYRALDADPDTDIDMHLTVADGAWGEWLAQETILFDRARVRRRLSIDMAGSAHVLAVESTVFGRRAMNERFEHGLLHDVWRIRRDGRLIWVDALHLDTERLASFGERFAFAGACGVSTLLCAGPRAASQLDMARCLLDKQQMRCGVHGGVTTMDDILLVRLIGIDAMALREATIAVAAALRAAVGELPARLPRVWHC